MTLDYMQRTSYSLPTSAGFSSKICSIPNINTISVTLEATDDSADTCTRCIVYGSLDDTNYYALKSTSTATYVDGYSAPETFDVSKYSTLKFYATNTDITPATVYIIGYETQKQVVYVLDNQTTVESLDGYQTQITVLSGDLDALELLEGQRWTNSSQQRQDLRNACDGYATVSSLSAYATTVSGTFSGATDGYAVIATGTGTGAGVEAVGGATGYGLIAKADITSPVKAAFKIVPQDTAPTSAEMGDIYVNSATGKIYCYNGAIWVEL